MKPTTRSLLKRLLPRAALRRIRDAQVAVQGLGLPSTRRVFQGAPPAPGYLDPELLSQLSARYPELPEYGYSGDELARRGSARAKEVLKLPGASTATRFLEIGCWDGMVSGALQQRGKHATAVDNRADGFDARASAAGARLLQADAAHLDLEDESFDFVFSYDTLEHVSEPDRVVREAARVTRRGGHVFLQFGPLFLAPFGQHAYRSIPVPYCQVLFARQALQEFVSGRGLAPIEFADVNEWPLQRYRGLWDQCAAQLRRVEYREIPDLSHLDLIREHPSCFRAKSELLDDFIVATIHVVFQKQS